MSESDNLEEVAYQAIDGKIQVEEVRRRLASALAVHLQRLNPKALDDVASGKGDECAAASRHVMLDAGMVGAITTAGQIEDAVQAVASVLLDEHRELASLIVGLFAVGASDDEKKKKDERWRKLAQGLYPNDHRPIGDEVLACWKALVRQWIADGNVMRRPQMQEFLDGARAAVRSPDGQA